MKFSSEMVYPDNWVEQYENRRMRNLNSQPFLIM